MHTYIHSNPKDKCHLFRYHFLKEEEIFLYKMRPLKNAKEYMKSCTPRQGPAWNCQGAGRTAVP